VSEYLGMILQKILYIVYAILILIRLGENMQNDVGARLKKLREDSKYTQKQLANYLGINQGQLSKIENGNRNLNLSSLDKLSSLYNCSHEYILTGSGKCSIPKVAFRNNENIVDLNVVAKINQITKNLKFLRSLNNEE